MLRRKIALVSTFVSVLIVLSVSHFHVHAYAASKPEIPTIPEATIRFGVSGTVDHTTVAPGLAQGWFKEVGITLKDIVLTHAQRLPTLVAGRIDVLDFYLPSTVPALAKTPNLKFIFLQDMFYGFAFMAHPDGGYKTFEDFRKEGLSPSEALKKAVQQMKGKRYLYSEIPSTMGFQEVLFKKADMSISDVKGIKMSQEKHLAVMLAGKADFQCGNVPVRVTLQSKGFIPIITTRQILDTLVELSPEAEELTMIGQSGWMCKDEYLEDNYDTILRLTGVGFRIMDLINKDPDKALSYHLPYVNRVAGTEITKEMGMVVYNSLDPFRDFKYQEKWYLEEGDPEYWKWVAVANINMFEKKGVLPKGMFTPESVCSSQLVYFDLLNYKVKSEALFSETNRLIMVGEGKGKSMQQAKKLFERGKKLHAAFDYLDSYRFAEAAKKWAEFEGK